MTPEQKAALQQKMAAQKKTGNTPPR
jgi:hypothetical protein